MAAQHAAPQKSTATATAAPITYATLHHSILARLALALDAAAARLQSTAAGRSTFTSDADLKAALALLRLAPVILPLLQPEPPPPKASPPSPPPSSPSKLPFSHDIPFWKQPGFPIPLSPKCPLCNKGPGAHWAEDCPENPDRHLPHAEKCRILREKGIKQ
jgi:hypothetical protein